MRKKSIYILLLWLAIVSFGYSKAQSVCIEKINPQNGANSFTAVYAMHQDADGIIYLATDKGLFYYAGNIIQYYKNAATNYLDIINLYKDKNQTIWALPYHGKIFSVSNSKAQERELRFFGDDNYKAYYAFTDEAGDLHFQVSYQNESYVASLTKTAKLVTQQIKSHPAGFAAYYFKSKQLPLPYAEQLTANVVGRTTQEIRFCNDEYFTLKNSILLIRNGKADTIFDGNQYGLQASAIVQFVINNSNDIYIAVVGSKKGLYHYNGKLLEPIYTTEGANSILKDPRGNYYFTDLSNRLLIIHPHQISKLDLPVGDDFQIKKIYGLTETDSLVMQSSDGSAYYYDLIKKQVRLIEKNLHQENSNKLLECNARVALLSADQLHFYKPNKQYALQMKPMANYSNIQLDLYQHHNFLFLFLKNYCMSYDLIHNTSTFQGFKFKLNTIKPYDGQQLLLFTDKGNYTFQLDTPNQIIKVPDQHQADSADILKYTGIGDTEYFLTPDKILRKKKTEKNHYALEFSSVLNNFNCYVVDFFAANEYLIFIKQKHIDFYNTITKQYYSYKVPYLEDEELISGGFTKQQSIYFYSKKNIYSLPFDFLNNSKQIPALIISEGLYNGDNIHDVTKDIVVQYTAKNNIMWRFDLVNVTFETSGKLSYKLFWNEKPEEQGIIKGSEISFSNLKYGKYALQILYENKVIKSIGFEYRPSWYQTNLFKYMLMLAALTIAIAFTYLILYRSFLKRKNEIETQNRLLTLESSSKLNQLKPHFIFNALMPLQNYILKSDKENALNYLKEFSALTRTMLTISRSSYVSIHEEIAFLNNYLSVQQTEKSNAFDYTIENQLPFDLSRANIMPTLLLQPLAENAIDHGMTRDMKQKGFIRICFAPFDEQHFKASILDNGPGFSTEKKEQQAKNHALSIIEERISLMRKRTDLTQLHYSQTSAGFQITLILPINPHP